MKTAITAFLALFIFSAPSFASEVMDEIKARCKTQMSEYGPAIVKACIDSDLESIPKIQERIETHPKIVDRCMSQMRNMGFNIVQACIEQDVEAQEAIDNY